MNIGSSYVDLIYSIINNSLISVFVITLLNNLYTLPIDIFLNKKIPVLIGDLNAYIDNFYKLDDEEEKQKYKFEISKIYKKHKKMLMFSALSSIISFIIFAVTFYGIEGSSQIMKDNILFGINLDKINTYIMPIIITGIYFFINKHIVGFLNLKEDKSNIQQKIITIAFIILVFGFALKSTIAANIFIMTNEVVSLFKLQVKKSN